MEKVSFLLFVVLCTITPCKDADSFHEIALNGTGLIAKGYLDRYETPNGTAERHTVWLYTDAACDALQWTLGEQKHSEHLACGTTMGFINVPAGTYHMVIEGCGGRIAAYLSIKREMHLMIEPPDLSSTDRCPGDDRSGGHNSYYVDFLESLSESSFISGL